MQYAFLTTNATNDVYLDSLVRQPKLMKRIFSILSLLFLGLYTQAQITLAPGITADQAVQYLLGPNVTYFNAQFTGDPGQLGYLTGGGAPTAFDIEDGVTLSSGHVNELQLGATVPGITGGVANNPDLLEVANSVFPMIGLNLTIQDVNDQAILEFDFIATGNTLSFDYIFGSDEYLTYVDQVYNDVFAFFLAGPGITGDYSAPPGYPGGSTNIAIIPGSDPALPITISSLNNEDYSEFYVDNPAPNQAIGSNGYTVPLLATYPLLCGETYHIKLAIADAQDGSLQSFVTLRAGSFNVGNNLIQPVSVNISGSQGGITGFPSNAILEGESCYDGFFVISPPPCLLEPDTITLYFGGDATLNEDYTYDGDTTLVVYPGTYDTLYLNAMVDDIAEGTNTITYGNITSTYETITIGFIYQDPMDTTGLDMDTTTASMIIVDYNPISVSSLPDIGLCEAVIPESYGPNAINANTGVPPYLYQWENPLGEVITNNDTAFFEYQAPGIVPGQYWLTVSDFCGLSDSLSFEVTDPVPVNVNALSNVILCQEQVDVDVLAAISQGAAPYSFTWSNPTNQVLLNNSPNPVFSFLPWDNTLENGNYKVVVNDYCGTSDSTTLNLQIPVPPMKPVTLPDSLILGLCTTDTLTLTAWTDQDVSYKWWYYDATDSITDNTPEWTSASYFIGSAFPMTYWCRVTEPFCGYNESIHFTVLPLPCTVEFPNVMTGYAGDANSYSILCSSTPTVSETGEVIPALYPEEFEEGQAIGNQTFHICGLFNPYDSTWKYPNSTLKVFNRWGNVVYESADYKNDWKISDLSEGVYYYEFVWNRPKKEYYTGSFNVLK